MREDFTTALKEAMKAGDKLRVGTLRMITSALKDRDIEARGNGKGPIPNDEILSMLQKMIKQRQESVAIYDQGGRPELAEQERQEIAIIAAFLPQQLSPDETRAAIAGVIAEIGAAGMKDMGKVMGVLKERFPGRIDFGKANPVVRELLGA